MISTLAISLSHSLRPSQISSFRKYLLSLSDKSEALMHNHDPETGNTLSRYPMVQYRSVDGNACLYAINEGIPSLRRFLDQSVKYMDPGEPSLWSQVTHLDEKTSDVRMTEKMMTYRINNYLPFDRVRKDNRNAYVEWKQCADLKERCVLLERILVNNLVTFCKYMDCLPEEKIVASLQQIDAMTDVKLHGNPFLCFDLTYKTNLLLPPGIALGKGVSHGFGVQHPFVPAGKKHSRMHRHSPSQSGKMFELAAELQADGHEGV